MFLNLSHDHFSMRRHPRDEWIKIRQRRVVDEIEYYADRLYKTQTAANSYAKKLRHQGKEVLVFRTIAEGGRRGYASFVRR